MKIAARDLSMRVQTAPAASMEQLTQAAALNADNAGQANTLARATGVRRHALPLLG